MNMSIPMYLTVTFAQSLDGRIATLTGQSQWISGDRTLRIAHRLRKNHDSILVGIGTVLKDDPELTCRLVRGNSPVRVVLDSELSIPTETKLVKTASRYPTIVLCSPGADRNRVQQLRSREVQVAEVNDDGQGNLDVDEVLQFLASKGLRSLLVEGGSGVITSFLRSGQVDRLVVVTAPIIIGEGIPCVGDLGCAIYSRRIGSAACGCGEWAEILFGSSFVGTALDLKSVPGETVLVLEPGIVGLLTYHEGGGDLCPGIGGCPGLLYSN